MAGVKISGITDLSGDPDGTELVEVTSDPSGTPITRRVSTQDIADLYDLETHASTHENGGSDEIDVTGLSGVLADAQTAAAHASTHEDGGADAVNAGNLTGTITSTSQKFEVADGVKTGSTDRAAIEVRDQSLINTVSGLSVGLTASTVGQDGVYVVSFAGGIYRLDRRGLSIITSNTTSVSAGPMCIAKNGEVVQIANTLNAVYNQFDLSYRSFSQSNGSIYNLYTHPVSGKIYGVNTSGDLQIIDADDYTTLSSDAITGLTGTVIAVIVDSAEEYAYVLDGPPTTSGSAYLRKIPLTGGSAFTVTSSSSAIPTVGCQRANIYWHDSMIVLAHDNNASQTAIKIDFYNQSLTKTYTGSTTVISTELQFFEGCVYYLRDVSGLIVDVYQLPSQTVKLSSHLDGSTVQSSVFPHNGKYYSDKDWSRAVDQLTSDRYNNYIYIKRSGQFTVPSGTDTGYFDIEIPGVLGLNSIDEIADLKADVSLFVDKLYTITNFENAQSEHIGAVASVGSVTTDWEDTLQPNSTIDWLTTIEQQDAGDGSLVYRVSWDATSRASDQVVKYQVSVRGPVWPLNYTPA